MSLRWFYRPNWTPGDAAVEFTGDGATYGVRLYTLDATEYAEEGSVGMFNVVVDDPQGIYDFPPLTALWAVETDIAGSSNTRVAHGYIADRTVHRGDSGLTGSGRVWEISVADTNSALGRRVFSQPDANRPAETDVQRILWLANVAEGQLLIDDTQFLSTASPVNMDAVDYRGQTQQDVLSDCANQSGKNYWAWFNELLGISLWYGHEDLTAYSSMVRLSNDIDDVDNLFTFYIGRSETKLVRDPSRMASSVYLTYQNGAVYVRDQTRFGDIGLRDVVLSADNVKTSAKATARANRYLSDLGTEDDRITTQVRLPAAKCNWIRAGMRVQVKAVHLPGYDEFSWMRVLRRSIAQDSEETYLLTLELSAEASTGACGDLSLTQDSGIEYLTDVNTLPNPLGSCLQVWVEMDRNYLGGPTMPTPAGFTQIAVARGLGSGNSGRLQMAYRITQPGDSLSVTSLDSGSDRAHILYEFGGVDSLIDSDSANEQPNASSIAGSVTTSIDDTLVIGAFMKTGSGPAGGNTLPDLGISAPATASYETGTLVTQDQGPTLIVGYQYVSGSSSHSMTATGSSTGFATGGEWAYVMASFR